MELRRGRRNAAIGSCSASQFTAVYQSGSHCCYLPVSPVCSAATGRRPRHPGLTTAFPLRDRARCWPCHLAHMELAVMSRPQGRQSPVRPAGQLVTSQPPILDSSRPDKAGCCARPLLLDLLPPFVIVILKKHTVSMSQRAQVPSPTGSVCATAASAK